MSKSPAALIFCGRAQRAVWAQALIVLASAAVFAVLWRVFKDDVCAQDVYLVRKEKIRVLDPPVWIPKNFVDEALELLPDTAKNRPLNASDPKLAAFLRDAFSAHPLVARVESVCVAWPAVVSVRLEFREPVAIIDVGAKGKRELLRVVSNRFPEDRELALESLGFDDDSTASDERDVDDSILLDADSPEDSALNDERFVVDSDAYRLPSERFAALRELCAALPVVVGLSTRPTTQYGASGDDLAKEAAGLARFLKESQIISEIGATRIYSIRSRDGARRAHYFLARNGALVKWGTFEPPEKEDDDAKEYGLAFAETDKDDAKSELYDYQYRKVEKLVELAVANMREIEVAAASSDPQKSANAQKLRKFAYDVSRACDEFEISEKSAVKK